MIKVEKGRFYKLIKYLWMTFTVGFILLFLFIWGINVDFMGLFGGMPDLEALENPKSELSSEIYSADGKLMGKYHFINRQPIEFEEIAPGVVDALKATEDVRFEEHSGVDFTSIWRVLVKTVILRKRSAGGGSTITQQLAKNLFKTRKMRKGPLAKVPMLGTVIVKIKEWILAIDLEKNYTKKEIMTMYLNVCEFGSNSFGIEAASRTFFNKACMYLDVTESATLVGMLQAPTRYSPVIERSRKRCFDRRNTVLSQMKKYKYITDAQFRTYKVQPIVVDYNPDNRTKGIAPYFRSEAKKFLMKWAESKGFDPDIVYKGGLKIYTTIDSRIQDHAEKALEAHMKEKQKVFFMRWKNRNPWVDQYGKELKGYIAKQAKRTYHYRMLKKKFGDDEKAIMAELSKPRKMKVFDWYVEGHERDTIMSPLDSIGYYKHFLQTGFMAMEPKTGQIKAWVGGINYKYFQYDHVYQGKRQPGSTFKPVVYSAALDLGYTPCYKMVDQPVVFADWVPRNSYGGYTGAPITLRRALGQSVNSIAAGLMKELGPDRVIKYAKNLGIETPLPRVASICLGSSAISLYELLGAYGVFANRGYYTKPWFISKIIDKNGRVLEEFSPEVRQAMSEETAYQMLHMLTAALEAGGTSTRLRQYGVAYKNQIGAKTGTTQNHADAWFVGVTQDLIAGVWVGGDDMHIRFLSIIDGQGAVLALPAWGRFFRRLYNDPECPYKKRAFERPERMDIELDCSKYNDGTTGISVYEED